MSKQLVPFYSNDISALAKSLRSQMTSLGHQPSHVEMLNMLARANGHTNFQHLRATPPAGLPTPIDPAPEPDFDHARVEKVLRHFDAQGRMIRWPAKTNHQDLCLWGIWRNLPPDERFSEAEINRFIIAAHSFGDHALLRRSLVDAQMLARTQNGRIYLRLNKQPPPDAQALLTALADRKLEPST